MKTNEIFEHVLQIVCEECELCYGELINGANKNAVDARCLLICALVSLGFSEENTAAYLSMTRQGVNKLKNSLKQRCSGSFILTTTNPFANYSIKEQIYGRPYFLTLEERDRVYNLPMPNNPFLAIQRDIFVFQCMIGCRVSDLYRLTRENINDGAIEYVPTKTKGDNQEYARVPLTKKAIEILEKYKEYGGRTLFPFISEQKYNDSIKKILKMAGIDRKVTVINPVTQKEEQKPIYEIASSHLARRTFIGNIYKKVKDPNIIGSMSGHVEGSKAFARYRDIDDEIKLDVLKEIE